MLQIQLLNEPVQRLRTVVDGQRAQIYLRQKPQGLFVDVNINGVDVVTSSLALDTAPIVPRDYAGMSGNLMFLDTRGNDDPHYSEFNSRFFLVYLTAEEYGQL